MRKAVGFFSENPLTRHGKAGKIRTVKKGVNVMHLTEAERKVMEVLWEQDNMTA